MFNFRSLQIKPAFPGLTQAIGQAGQGRPDEIGSVQDAHKSQGFSSYLREKPELRGKPHWQLFRDLDLFRHKNDVAEGGDLLPGSKTERSLQLGANGFGRAQVQVPDRAALANDFSLSRPVGFDSVKGRAATNRKDDVVSASVLSAVNGALPIGLLLDETRVTPSRLGKAIERMQHRFGDLPSGWMANGTDTHKRAIEGLLSGARHLPAGNLDQVLKRQDGERALLDQHWAELMGEIAAKSGETPKRSYFQPIKFVEGERKNPLQAPAKSLEAGQSDNASFSQVAKDLQDGKSRVDEKGAPQSSGQGKADEKPIQQAQSDQTSPPVSYGEGYLAWFAEKADPIVVLPKDRVGEAQANYNLVASKGAEGLSEAQKLNVMRWIIQQPRTADNKIDSRYEAVLDVVYGALPRGDDFLEFQQGQIQTLTETLDANRGALLDIQRNWVDWRRNDPSKLEEAVRQQIGIIAKGFGIEAPTVSFMSDGKNVAHFDPPSRSIVIDLAKIGSGGIGVWQAMFEETYHTWQNTQIETLLQGDLRAEDPANDRVILWLLGKALDSDALYYKKPIESDAKEIYDGMREWASDLFRDSLKD